MKLVIFDMDGTMLDSERVSLEAMFHTGKVMGVEISLEICESLMGKNAALIREILTGIYGETYDFDEAMRLHEEYVDDFYEKNGVPIKPGLLELLDKLDAQGIRKRVATSTSRARAVQKLEGAGILHRFEKIIGGDEIENGKPAPDIFLKAAGDTPLDDCIIIEDTEAGVLGATAAGIRVILVPDIAPLNEKIRNMAFAVCADLHEVARFIPTASTPV